jgi:hypothetical protein
MPNPYITNVDPYMSQQDLSGYAPTMQDIAQQKLMQQLALAQQNQQVQEAGQQQGGGMSGLSPLAMAMMLRKKPDEPAKYTGPSYGTNPNFSNSHFDTMSYD